MTRIPLQIVAVPTLLAIAAPAVAQTLLPQCFYRSHTFYELPMPAGHSDAVAMDITEAPMNLPKTIVGSAVDSQGRLHCVTWDWDTWNGATVSSTLGFNDECELFGVSGNGEAVGRYTSPGTGLSLVYDIFAGTQGTLGALGSSDSVALDINDHGVFVGAATNPSRAYLYNNATGVTFDLGNLGGNSRVEANAINSTDQVVGVSTDGNGDEHAFFMETWVLWGQFSMEDLGTLYGHGDSAAEAVNENGVVVGTSVSGWQQEATRWERGWSWWSNFWIVSGLGAAPGHAVSAAHDVNLHGDAVGHSGSELTTATLFPQGAAAVDLHDLVCVMPAGWRMENARAINDTGDIVGWGRHNGDRKAFLLLRQEVL